MLKATHTQTPKQKENIKTNMSREQRVRTATTNMICRSAFFSLDILRDTLSDVPKLDLEFPRYMSGCQN